MELWGNILFDMQQQSYQVCSKLCYKQFRNKFFSTICKLLGFTKNAVFIIHLNNRGVEVRYLGRFRPRHDMYSRRVGGGAAEFPAFKSGTSVSNVQTVLSLTNHPSEETVVQ